MVDRAIGGRYIRLSNTGIECIEVTLNRSFGVVSERLFLCDQLMALYLI